VLLRRCLLSLLLPASILGCAADDAGSGATPGSVTPAPATTVPAATVPATTVPATTVPTATVPVASSTVPSSEPVPPGFSATVAPIDDAVRARMPHAWRPGCPVPLEELRLLTLAHWDLDGQPRTGELVVHESVADDLVTVFRTLWDVGFPITRMELVDVFEADDDRSMAADNTSAFNCREIAGRPGVWSNHAFGRAVDINPLRNPWVRGDQVDPPGGAAYLDRTADVPGLIRDGDVVVAAFAAVGWSWGGHWSTPDYQHFEHAGD
jgi:hypothetical protein